MEPTEKAITIALALVAIAAVAFASKGEASPEATAGGRAQIIASASEPQAMDRAELPPAKGRATQGPSVDVDVSPVPKSAPPMVEDAVEPDPVESLAEDSVDVIFLEPLEEPVQADVRVDSDLSVLMSDQEVLDLAMQALTPEQQLAFRELWRSLGPSEKREWLDGLRISFLQE